MPIATSGERIRVSAEQILENLRQGFLTLGVCLCVSVCVLCVCALSLSHSACLALPPIYLSPSPPSFRPPLFPRALALSLGAVERRRRSAYEREREREREVLVTIKT